jgi:hypothetical protein
MSPRTVRRIVVVVFFVGVVGMIVGSIADNNGTAITFGLIAAGASVGLILVTAVAGPDGFARNGADRPVTDEVLAEDVERRVEGLVAAGADEGSLRDLVRSAVRLGRQAERAR